MLKLLLSIIALLPLIAYSQRELKPSIHLKPFQELEQATVTALAEDQLGQIWLGTQIGLRYWDGVELHTPQGSEQIVTSLHSKDSCIYSLDLNSIRKINSYTGKESALAFPYSDYRYCNFKSDYILTISADLRDTLLVDYDLQVIEADATLELTKRIKLGKIEIFKKLNSVYLIDETDTSKLSYSFVRDLIKYDSNTAFISTHEGLIEIRVEEKLTKTIHLSNQRIEQLLVDLNKNLWVGTAEHGLYMFHRNTIQNRYYPLKTDHSESIAAWRFAEIEDKIYVCTSNGMISIGNRNDQIPVLEKQTRGLFCFSALATLNKVLIGTAKEGLYAFENGKLSRLYFNSDNNLDNTVIQILQEKDGYLFTTKWGFHRLNNNGKVIYSRAFPKQKGKAYSMNIEIHDGMLLSAGTNGVQTYSTDLELIKDIGSPEARVFSDLEFFGNKFWFSSMDAGLYLLSNDSLIKHPSPQNKLLNLTAVGNHLWSSGITGVIRFDGNNHIEYGIENGFPIQEYAQGGLFNQGDSLLYFSGVGGVFIYRVNQSEKVNLPYWKIQRNNEFLFPSSTTSLKYDQSIVNILPKAVITSDLNRFNLSFFNGNKWSSVENGQPLLLELGFGNTTVQFKIENILTHEHRIEEYHFYRITPIWLKPWFQLLLGIAGLFLMMGMYALFRFYKTRKLLKREAEERKITQERLRISRELHDNIGARLSHIISSLDIQLFKDQGSDEIATINSFARETMNQLRETIWAVSDKTIFFSELKQRIEHYMTQTNSISATNILYKDQSTSDFELNATETINLFRIIQEAVNNALKYSSAKEIIVEFDEKQGMFVVTITDNGKGFSLDTAIKQGSGLTGMKSRADEIGIVITIDSHLDAGTKVKLVMSRK